MRERESPPSVPWKLEGPNLGPCCSVWVAFIYFVGHEMDLGTGNSGPWDLGNLLSTLCLEGLHCKCTILQFFKKRGIEKKITEEIDKTGNQRELKAHLHTTISSNFSCLFREIWKDSCTKNVTKEGGTCILLSPVDSVLCISPFPTNMSYCEGGEEKHFLYSPGFLAGALEVKLTEIITKKWTRIKKKSTQEKQLTGAAHIQVKEKLSDAFLRGCLELGLIKLPGK